MQCEQEMHCMTTIKALGIAAVQWGYSVNGGKNFEL